MADETKSLLVALGGKPSADSGSESHDPKPEESTEGVEHALREAGFSDVSPAKARAFRRLVRMAMG